MISLMLATHALAAEPARLTFDTACGTTTVLYDGNPAIYAEADVAEYAVQTEGGTPGVLRVEDGRDNELLDDDWIITYYSTEDIETIVAPIPDPIEPVTTVPFAGDRFSESGTVSGPDCSSEGEGIQLTFEAGTAGPSFDDRVAAVAGLAADAYEARYGRSVKTPRRLADDLAETLEGCGALGHLGGAYGDGSFVGTDDAFAPVTGTYDGASGTIELVVEGVGTFSGTLDRNRQDFIAVGPDGLVYLGVYRRRRGRFGTWYAKSGICTTSHL